VAATVVLATLLYGFVIVGVVVASWPSGPRSGSALTQCGPIHLSLLNQMRTKDKLPVLDYAQCLKESEKVRPQIELREQQDQEELSEKRAMRILSGIMYWVLGSGLLYLFGWLIAWVRQGFRRGDRTK